MNIKTFGKDARLEYCREYLLRSCTTFVGDMIILPIPSSKDGVNINGSDKKITDIYEYMKSGDVLVGYALGRSLREEAAMKGILIIDLSRNEPFLQENARLSAEGVLGRILTEHNASVSDLHIGIIGYGRIGQRLLNMLMFLGAKVTLYTTKTELRQELCGLGVSCAYADSVSVEESLRECALDILINTAPANIIPESAADALIKTRVMELASGDNIPMSVIYERYASIPAKAFPKSAGYAMGRAIIDMLGVSDS